MIPSLPGNPNPNYQALPTASVDLPPPSPPPSPPATGGSRSPVIFSFPKRPSIRLTSEFDSDSSVFFHKVSCKLFDSLAKLKLSFHNNHKGELSPPHLALVSKHLSINYDFEDQSTLLSGSVDVGPRLQLRATHDLKVTYLSPYLSIFHFSLLTFLINFALLTQLFKSLLFRMQICNLM